MCDTHEDYTTYPKISLDNCPTTEDVHIALLVLHHHPDKMEKKGASTWLSNVQSSVHAWDLSLMILQEDRDLESTFFGAQTIRLKIQTSLHELSAEQRLQIRNKLFAHLKAVDNQSNIIVVKRLCLALADLTFKLHPWANPIEDIINELCTPNVVIMMYVLKAIPEEVVSSPMEHSLNLEVTEYLKRYSPVISSLLDGVLAHFRGSRCEVTIVVLTVTCLTAWIPLHTLRVLVETQVCEYAFQSMMSVEMIPDEIQEAVSTFISALLEALKATPTLSEIGNHLIRKVRCFEKPYHLAVAHEDHHKVLSYSKIFTEVADCFLPEIVAQSTIGHEHYAMDVFNLVLQCVGHHDYEVADRTFDLWFSLSEQISEEIEVNPRMVSFFRPYIERLIVALCNNCQMEPDQATLLEDGDEFQDFRTRTFELVQEVVFIVGADRCFQKFLELLLQSGGQWEAYEATLFIMSALASKVDSFDEPMMHQIFETIMNFSQDNSHIAIRNTILLLLGEFSPVISAHRDYLAISINYIIDNLNDPILAPQSAASLRAICLWSPNNVIVHLVRLFQLTASLDSYPIPNDAALDLLKGIASVLKVLDTPRLEIALKHLSWPQVAGLSELVHGDLAVTINTRTDPVVFLDRLTTIFKCASPSKYAESKHPFLPMYEGILSVLLVACNKYKTDTRILKRCCRAVRFGLKAMGRQSTELLGPVQKMLLGILADYHYKCLFKLALTLVELYLGYPSCSDELHDILRKLTEPTINHLLLGQDHFVEEVFQIIRIFIRDSPTAFLQRTFTEEIFHTSITALTLNPVCATARRCSLRFLYEVMHSAMINQSAVDYFLRRQLVGQFVDKYGESLMMALWCVIVEEPSQIVPVSHIFLMLRHFNDVLSIQYLKASIEALPTMFPGGKPVVASEAPLCNLYEDMLRTGTMEGMCRVLERFSCLFAEKSRVRHCVG